MRAFQKLRSVPSAVGCLVAVFVATGTAAESLTQPPPTVVEISPDGIQRATIILDSYSYSPSDLIVKNGIPVELTLSSVTSITPHNFIIQEPSSGLLIEQDVRAGKTVIVRFVPTQPGRFVFFCDKRLWPLPSHRDKGMEGILEVR